MPSSWTIIIDTSVSSGILALLKGDIVVDSVILEPRRQEELLADQTKKFLEATKAQQGNLCRIVLGDGPGSFTGLRISHAFVKGFIAHQSIPVILVSSLLGYTLAMTPSLVTPVSIAINARQGEFFIQQISSSIVEPARVVSQEDSLLKVAILIEEKNLLSLTAQQIANGFISASERYGLKLDCHTFASREPQYGRAASAKTLKERKISSSSL